MRRVQMAGIGHHSVPLAMTMQPLIALTSDPDEDQADTMYAKFDDGTIATIQGVPQIHFHREAGSLEEAIRSAIGE
jgi:hypothetical protein